MKKLLLVGALIASLGASLAAPAWAGPPNGGDHGGSHSGGDKAARAEAIADQLNLTEAQKEQIRQIMLKYRRQSIDIKARKEKAQLDLVTLLGAPQLDEKGLNKALAEINAAEAELKQARLNQMIEIRKVLTPEQWQQLVALYRAERGDRWERWMMSGGEGRD